MKTIRRKLQSEQGTILFVTLIATAIIGAALASYLRLVANQNYSVARSQAWNRAMPVLEAGLEEAMAQINKSASAASLVANGWVLTGTNYVKQTAFDGEYANVKIALLAFPILESQGFTKVPLGNGDMVSRRVRATTKRTSPFTKAMAADGQIDLLGNNVTADSFDSSNVLYSVGGLYHPSIRRANGDIATNGQLLNGGNADVYGHVATGPGGTSNFGSNGAVGDLAWHAAGNSGIQPGAAADDMNVEFPPVPVPYTLGLPPIAGAVGGTNYAYVLSGTGAKYSMSSLSLSGSGSIKKILVTGDVSLHVTGNVSLSGQAGFIIAPGARLRMYVGTLSGPPVSASLGGSGVVNGTGNAANFSYSGLPSNTSISFSGNAAFVGTIYAPSAALHLGGGGSTTYDFVGASVSKTVQMNGHFNFHYDENLGKATSDGYYVVTSWNEL